MREDELSETTEVVQAEALPDISRETSLERLQHKPIIDVIDRRTLALIKSQIAPGCTDAEVAYGLEIAARYDLDVFAHEAWIAKGRGDNGRLLIMVGRDGLRKIANRNNLRIDGDVVRERDSFRVTRDPQTRTRTIAHAYEEARAEDAAIREGEKTTEITSRGKVIGAWAEVWDSDSGEQRGYFYAPIAEYRPTNETKLKYSPWGSQESVMILAAAERQALRQATPLSGLLAIGEDARIEREELSLGEGTGESLGLELSDEIEAVITRAEVLGHAGLSERAAWEYHVSRPNADIAEKVRAAHEVLDALEARREAEEITDADVEPEIPFDDSDLPEPPDLSPSGQAEVDSVDPVEDLGGGDAALDEGRPTSSSPASGDPAAQEAPLVNVEALRRRLALLQEKKPQSPEDEALRDEEIVWLEGELARAAELESATNPEQESLL